MCGLVLSVQRELVSSGFFFQAEDGIRDLVRSRGLGDVYKRQVAIVLPTIALLDEFRRRLRRRFHDKFELIMHPEEQAIGDNVIFLGTQERLLNRSDIGVLDLTVVDEFYKLDPRRKDERNVTLNAAVSRLLRKSRQFFFLGPNIDDVTMTVEGRWNCLLYTSDAADDLLCVDPGGPRIIKKKKKYITLTSK